jgi:acetylornithine deacetylase/succinyl-diaminopimelate desuccinylase-like protein
LKLQGLEAQVQRTGIASLVDTFPGPYGAGTVENILVRLKGTNSTGVLLLTAHYDSVSTAPGATDDGSGVVTLLETLRALRSGEPLKRQRGQLRVGESVFSKRLDGSGIRALCSPSYRRFHRRSSDR